MSSFWENYLEIENQNKYNFGQGNTPIIKLIISGKQIIIKDENTNPNGSFKDRGISYQMARHIQEGKSKFALSSSGNAAISAAYLAQHYQIELQLFLGNNINQEKFIKIKSLISDSKFIKLFSSDKPRSDLIKFIKTNDEYINLRGSLDKYAIPGFKSIAYELVEQIPEIDSIFIPCSSGTSTVGIYEGFVEKNHRIKVIICQTEKIHSLSSDFDKQFVKQEKSLADAITDRVAMRKKQINSVLESSQGSGFVISDSQLREDKQEIDSYNIGNFSYNSILAFSGWKKAIKLGYNFKNPVLLFSGL